MSTFSKSFKWDLAIEDIKKVFTEYPLELQLVWLVEIIILKAFGELKDKNGGGYFEFDEDYYFIKPKKLGNFLEGKGLDSRCYGKLVNYRNLFVHAGIRSKSLFLFLMKKRQNEICSLAEYAEVDINFADSKLLGIKG